MASNALISILLPSYRSDPVLLKLAIESVLMQSFEDWELILIDDSPEAEVSPFLQEYPLLDSRIRILNNGKNLGLIASLNAGIRASEASYIARIDDDDLWSDPDKLQKQIQFLASDPHTDYAVVGTRAVHRFSDGTEQMWWVPLSDEEIRQEILYNCPFHHSSVLIRKSVLENLGYYHPACDGFEDRELRLRIGTQYKFANLEAPMIIYTHHNPHSITAGHTTFKAKLLINWKLIKLARKYRYHYPNFLKALALRCFACLPLLWQEQIVNWVKARSRCKAWLNIRG
ncbi:MAG: glycosyltransferase [bacterium]|nr:glycosyltransferase [bacterium]